MLNADNSSPSPHFEMRAEVHASYVRALALSILYLLALILIWNGVSSWLVTSLQGEPKYANMSSVLKPFGIEFVSLNALGFASTALWLARSRSFAPFARYVVPLLIALYLTLPITLIVMYVVALLAFALQAAGKEQAWMMTYLDSIIPGMIGAQLLRFPRSSRLKGPGDTSPRAV